MQRPFSRTYREFQSSPHLYALTCYMRLHSGNLFPSFSVSIVVAVVLSFTRARKRNPNPCSVEGKKKKIKVRAEKNLNGKKCFFIIFSGVASRAWWEKSRLEFFSFISLQYRHSFGSAIVSCFQSLMVNSRISKVSCECLAKFGVCGLLLIRIWPSNNKSLETANSTAGPNKRNFFFVLISCFAHESSEFSWNWSAQSTLIKHAQ